VFPSLTHNVKVAIFALYSFLTFATIVTYTLGALRPKKNYRELKQRVNSWWIIIVIFTGSIAGPPAAKIGFLAFVSFLALREYVSLIPTRKADRRIIFWCYLAVPLQFYWVSIHWYSMFLIFIPVYMFLFLPLRMVTIGETKGFLNAAGTLNWGLMTTVFSISHVAYLFELPPAYNPAGGGPGLVLYLVLLTQANDVAQYLWGKALGRHKVIPKVSPNKTVEGLLGGVFTTTVLSALGAPYLISLSFPKSVIAGLIISTAGFIGDVVISAIKRDIGVKDAGSLLPGHGGLLDRIDSLTYTAPIFFHCMKYLYDRM
jgi:phosphatidate cytidylyltransferase